MDNNDKKYISTILYNSMKPYVKNNVESSMYFNNNVLPLLQVSGYDDICAHTNVIFEPDTLIDFIKYIKRTSNIAIWNTKQYGELINAVTKFFDLSGY